MNKDIKTIVGFVGTPDSFGLVSDRELRLLVLQQRQTCGNDGYVRDLPPELRVYQSRVLDGRIVFDDGFGHLLKNVGYEMFRPIDELTGHTLVYAGKHTYEDPTSGAQVARRDVTFIPWDRDEVESQMKKVRLGDAPDVDYDVEAAFAVINSKLAVTDDQETLCDFLADGFPVLEGKRRVRPSALRFPHFFVATDQPLGPDDLDGIDPAWVQRKVVEYVKGLWTVLDCRAPADGTVAGFREEGDPNDPTRVMDFQVAGGNDQVVSIRSGFQHLHEPKVGQTFRKGQVMFTIREHVSHCNTARSMLDGSYEDACTFLDHELIWVENAIRCQCGLNDERAGGRKYLYPIQALSRIPKGGRIFANVQDVAAPQVVFENDLVGDAGLIAWDVESTKFRETARRNQAWVRLASRPRKMAIAGTSSPNERAVEPLPTIEFPAPTGQAEELPIAA